MSQLQGSSTSLRLGFEPTFGGTPTNMYQLPFNPPLTIQTTQELQNSETMTGKRSASEGFLGYKDLQATLNIPVDTKALGIWLKCFFNDPATTDNGNGTFTHEFIVNDTTIPSITLEEAQADALTLFYRHKGLKANTFGLSLGGDDELIMNIGMIGQDSTIETSQIAVPATTFNNGEKFYKFENVISGITSADDVQTYTIDYTNDLDGSSYTVNTKNARNDIPLGLVQSTGSIEALFQNIDLANISKNFTTQSINSTITKLVGGAKLEIIQNEIKINSVIGVSKDSPQGIKQNYTYSAFHKDNATASSIVIKLTNDIATYAGL